MTNAELERRVAELEAELAWRRNHVCPPSYVPPTAGMCTCGAGRDLTFPPPCPVHGFPARVFTTTLRPGQNVCGAAAGCAPPAQFFTIETGAAGQFFSTKLNPAANGCAGGWAGQTYTVTIPAG